MARSKFPGKPSKQMNKRRVNVLSASLDATQDESEDKDKTQHLPSDEVKRTRKRKLLRDLESRRRSFNRQHIIITETTSKGIRKSKMVRNVRPGCSNTNKRSDRVTKIRKLRTKQPLGESNNLVGKFVLPSRSVHSSRVIKPNKRFLNVEAISNIRKRVVNKRRNSIKLDTDGKKLTQSDLTRTCEVSKESDSSRRFILRQARLQLHTQTPSGTEGPFSATSSGNSSPPGTVTCGVCGAVRFYRFVKQARKFHIYSCESCRKFISKMIKRQVCGEQISTPLSCLKGQGMCHVPPIVRSQQWKLFRCAYRARCPACWLKMCLRSFQMPATLKQSLATLLPEFMRGHENLFSNLSLFSFHTNTGVDGKSAQLSPSLRSVDDKRIAQSRGVVKVSTNIPSDIKRHKIDLKGPRVKHVCRSASIVLGQPLATFADEKKDEQIEDKRNEEIIESKSIETQILIERNPTPKPDSLNAYIAHDTPEIEEVNEKGAICVDFWECYDPEEVSQTGFGLIAYEPFPIRGICFLCGSAGREPLLYCCMCCEPYHFYCLDQVPRNQSAFDWICPKCTSCNYCGKLERHKIHCQKCQKAYHPECLNRTENADQRMICSACLRCKGCGSENVTNFMGNLPLCLICFKIRKRENYCPMCKCSYDDNELQLKMLECVKCNRWIHAKCESVSNEEYQLISLLPESVEFTCCVCEASPQWRKAIVTQLRANFNYILRRLSKNRLAREALKCNSLNKFDDNDIDINSELNNNLSKLERTRLKNCRQTDSLDQESLIPTVFNIKNKLISNEYSSVSQFNKSMQEVMECTNSKELLRVYQDILKQIFPWYDSSETDSNSSILSDKEHTYDDSCLKTDHIQIKPLKEVVDNRVCVLCNGIGDGNIKGEARLLYCGANVWIHGNCALWSNDVYEEIDGSLQNVHKVINKASASICVHCKSKGASVECYAKTCCRIYHFACAQQTKCHFLQDKTFYCTSHLDYNSNDVISTSSEFSLRRLLYVERDRKQKTRANPDKIHYMVGSLCVTKLGKLLSLSDYADALIPIGFTCERLFWSTTEPWKLIPYVITTSVLNQNTQIFLDKHFTIDHTLPKLKLDKKLKEISFWQRELDKDVSMSCFDFDDEEEEGEEEEEPQNENNAPDILSPELTDAILKEFPHEFLDRISMQDIFPKFLNNEDLVSLDSLDVKTNECNSNDSLNKFARIELEKNFLDIEEDSFKRNKQSLGKDKLKCGINDNVTSSLKRRRLSRDKNMILKYVQLDGAYDSSSGSECESENSDEPVKCIRCECTYRTQVSYKRHLETCEVLSTTSDSDSDTTLEQHPSPIIVTLNPFGEGVASDITTYENGYETSYASSTYEVEVHSSLNSQTETYVDQSESEIISVQSSESVYSNFPQDEQMIDAFDSIDRHPTNQPTVQQSVGSVYCADVNSQPPVASNIPRMCINPPNTFINQTNNSVPFIQPTSVNQSSITLNPVGLHGSQLTVQSVPISHEMNPVINLASNSIAVDKILTPNVNSLISPTFSVPHTQFFKSPTTAPAKVIRPRGRPRSLAAKRRIGMERPLLISQNGHPVVMQQLPSTNVIPTFLETMHPQTNSNLQYLTTLNPQIQIAPTITSQPSLLQIQSENGLLNLVPSVQPTVLLQQPRVLGEQLIMDGGSLVWATQQVQPVFYGFETIVQNTVMQSQQFMPGTVPGVLTANSSYSSTTQVFQTSKLEPILDVSSGNIVLVNSGNVVSSAPAHQNVSNPITVLPTSIQPKQNWNQMETENISRKSNQSPQSITVSSASTFLPPTTPLPTLNIASNSISLPMAPFAADPGLPTNIVNPTLMKTTPTAQSRPMSRVLPMPTINPVKKVQHKISMDKSYVPKMEKIDPTMNKKILILDDVIVKPANDQVMKMHSTDVDQELKQIIEREVEEGLFKHNNYKTTLPITPLKSYNGKQPCMPSLTNPINIPATPVINIKPKMLSQPSHPSVQIRPPSRSPVIPFRSGLPPRPCPPTATAIRSSTPLRPTYNPTQVYTNIYPTLPPISPTPPEQPPSPLPATILKSDTNPKNIQENKENTIMYTVETKDGFCYSSTSMKELWGKIIESVQAARIANNMKPLPLKSISHLDFSGLKSNGLRYVIEQLPGARKCVKYKRKYRTDTDSSDIDIDDDIEFHYPYDSARCRIYNKSREPTDLFSWLSSRHRKPSQNVPDNLELITKRSTITSLPMAVRFRHLKATWKKSVGVYPSKIHKRGLFCLRDIENGEMVIEYTGEVIRSIVVDKREKEYQAKDVGCYMFKIDENFVVDATRMGNAARFINHSCDPNCYSKVIELQGRKHIIIFANRKIARGEELTYDYQFPLEDDKIPCSCGTTRCRKFLN